MFLFNYSTLIDPLLRDVRTYTAELLSAKKLQNVLDICCGTGNQVFHYTQRGLISIGIDQDLTMISHAEKVRRKYGLYGTDFYIAQATRLPFSDGQFDSASICLGLHEMNEVEQAGAVSEMKRVVKKGGPIIFTDFRVPFPKSPVALLVQAVEFLAGKDNHKCFSNYLMQGGLETILRRNHLRPQNQSVIKLGLLEVFETTNPWLIA